MSMKKHSAEIIACFRATGAMAFSNEKVKSIPWKVRRDALRDCRRVFMASYNARSCTLETAEAMHDLDAMIERTKEK